MLAASHATSLKFGWILPILPPPPPHFQVPSQFLYRGLTACKIHRTMFGAYKIPYLYLAIHCTVYSMRQVARKKTEAVTTVHKYSDFACKYAYFVEQQQHSSLQLCVNNDILKALKGQSCAKMYGANDILLYSKGIVQVKRS